MSRTAHKLLSASGSKGAYEIDQSVLLDDGDGALLHRTPSSEGNRKTWTFSCWFKRGQQDSTDNASGYYYLFGSSIYGGNETYIRVQGDHLHVSGYDGGSSDFSYYSNFLLRDLAAWYHVVVICDTTESAEADRVKVYLNGSQVTDWSGANHASLNFDTMINNTNWHAVGAYKASSGDGGLYRWDGYVAEAYLLDGTAKAVTAFGETDSETGQWIPKKTAFTSSEYGTNGFYLKFKSGAIGTDSSGKGNNYTTVNLANSDVMLDTPTNNYPTINALEPYNSTLSTLLEGNLHVIAATYDSGYYGNHTATFLVPASGKWYIETRMAVQSGTGNTSWIGVIDQRTAVIPKRSGSGATGGEYFTDSAFTGMVADLIASVDTIRLFDGGSAQETVTGATATSYIIALALDVDNNKVYGGYDSGSGITWLDSGNPAAGSNGQSHTFAKDTVIQLAVGPNAASNSNSKQTLNFGQNGTFSGQETAGGNADGNGEGNFFYSPPSGFLALCSKNLPTPAIKLPEEHFKPVLYTGTGNVDLDITVGFDPDWTWIKKRSEADDHVLTTATVGVGYILKSQSNAVQADWTDYVGPYITNGIRLNDVAQGDAVNEASQTYVMWNWKAGGGGDSPSANTDGSINTLGTSVNTTAGISISKYSGTGSNATVGHGLGVAPSVIIVKNRSTDDNWRVQTISDPTDYMAWNWTGASTDDAYVWNDTAATSSVFSIGSDDNVNRSSNSFLAICIADVPGFSKAGWYRGNGNANGTFVNLGFRPSYIMLKMRSTTVSGGGDWTIRDVKRDVDNPSTQALYTNLNAAESTTSLHIDIVSNGFKIRSSGDDINEDDETIWWMAFAEFPFKYANAR